MAYSMDLRLRVIGACDRGMKTLEVARLFQVSPAWVRRLKQRRRETGSIAPLKSPTGPRPKIGPEIEPLIHAHFRDYPGTTLSQLVQALQAHTGERYRDTTLWRAVRRLDYRFKKNR